jgi:gamma-glutamylcyclotransferase (GGCT)/AIG2-like uncharacterized protein YtfP
MDLDSVLLRINVARTMRNVLAEVLQMESELESQYHTSHRLAVYGSLAPGRKNHNQLADLAGAWEHNLYVEGELIDGGWGLQLGYPSLQWKSGGARIDVALFVSRSMPDHWDRLDRFEGEDYSRILVPVFNRNGLYTIANLYAANSGT